MKIKMFILLLKKTNDVGLDLLDLFYNAVGVSFFDTQCINVVMGISIITILP